MMKNLEVLEEIRKQGKNLIETKRDVCKAESFIGRVYSDDAEEQKAVRASDVVLSVRHYGNRDKVPGAESGILAFL